MKLFDFKKNCSHSAIFLRASQFMINNCLYTEPQFAHKTYACIVCYANPYWHTPHGIKRHCKTKKHQMNVQKSLI